MMSLVTEVTYKVVDTTLHTETKNDLTGEVSFFDNEKQIDASYTVTKEISPRDWKSLIRNDQDATTSMFVSSTTLSYRNGGGSFNQRSYAEVEILDDMGLHVGNTRGDLVSSFTTIWTGGMMNAGAPPAGFVDPSLADDRALSKFYSQCRKAQTLESGGTFVAEIREAIHGIRHPAESIVAFLGAHVRSLEKKRSALRKAIKQKDYTSAKRIAGVRQSHSNDPDRLVGSMVSNSWLEAQFHWLPLVGDLVSSAEALSSLQFRKESKRIIAYGSDEAFGDEIMVNDDSFVPLVLHYTRKQGHKIDVKYYGSVLTALPGDWVDTTQAATEALGLNISNFIPTIYNVIPFSFVADYFSNLGDVVDALSFPRSDLRWVARTAVDRVTEYCNPAGVTMPASHLTLDVSGSLDHGRLHVMSQTITRGSIDPPSLNIPSLEFKIPGIDKKWLNLSALGAQLFRYRNS
jgi:hypothetical protein